MERSCSHFIAGRDMDLSDCDIILKILESFLGEGILINSMIVSGRYRLIFLILIFDMMADFY